MKHFSVCGNAMLVHTTHRQHTIKIQRNGRINATRQGFLCIHTFTLLSIRKAQLAQFLHYRIIYVCISWKLCVFAMYVCICVFERIVELSAHSHSCNGMFTLLRATSPTNDRMDASIYIPSTWICSFACSRRWMCVLVKSSLFCQISRNLFMACINSISWHRLSVRAHEVSQWPLILLSGGGLYSMYILHANRQFQVNL